MNRPNNVTPIMPANTATPMAAAHFRTGAGRCDERHHTHDEGQRRHQDWAQPQTACLDHRLERRCAGELQLSRKLDDKDRVLGGEADKHDQPDLREDIVVPGRQPDASEGGQQPERHDHDDRERESEAFILR